MHVCCRRHTCGRLRLAACARCLAPTAANRSCCAVPLAAARPALALCGGQLTQHRSRLARKPVVEVRIELQCPLQLPTRRIRPVQRALDHARVEVQRGIRRIEPQRLRHRRVRARIVAAHVPRPGKLVVSVYILAHAYLARQQRPCGGDLPSMLRPGQRPLPVERLRIRRRRMLQRAEPRLRCSGLAERHVRVPTTAMFGRAMRAPMRSPSAMASRHCPRSAASRAATASRRGSRGSTEKPSRSVASA